jgi:hypothetical protein
MRIQRNKPTSNSGVKRGIILRRSPLSVGFFAQLDALDWIFLFQEIADLGGCVFRRVVQNADRHKNWQVISQFTSQNKIQAGLLNFVIDVLGSMPRIGR